MTRAELRELKGKESHVFREFLKVQKHFIKDFWSYLAQIKDPRHQSYIEYGIDEIITVPIMKNVCNLKSMQTMTKEFNTKRCITNFGKITGKLELSEIPHYVTVNDCLKKLETQQLEKVRTKMIKDLIRKRSFETARFLEKYWVVIIDATQILHFKERHCKHCLSRTYTNEETGEKRTIYYHNVLEAKIVLGDNFVVSIATEFIENPEEKVSKQDCETVAFKRLAKKLKKEFKRLPICIMGDSLYASEPVFKICDENQWKYLIRFKDGSIPSVAEEFHCLKGKEKDNQKDSMKWVNGIQYNERIVNVMEFLLLKKGKETKFQWISNIEITRKNSKEFTSTGRKRWKIENEGFNIQKNHRYEITHANSMDYTAIKNHYLLVQIADIILQLYEKGVPMLKQLKKGIKNISSDLLKSFAEQTLTNEDISYIQKRTSISIS